jgi:hypothetical protein
VGTGDVWLAVVTLSALAGLVVWNRFVVVVPPALTAAMFVGVDRHWWGGGLVHGWGVVYVIIAATGLVALAAGAGLRLLIDFAGASPHVPRWSNRWTAAALAIWAADALVYGYAHTRPADVSALRNSTGPELWYLGTSFEGLRLSHVDSFGGMTTLIYGDCDIPIGDIGDEGGCSVPLQLQNVSCPGEPTAVAIYAGTPRARRAAEALELLRGTGRTPRVAVGWNPFASCLQPATGGVPTITR